MNLSNTSDVLPYEKCLRYGAESLSDKELLAVIIRSGTKNRNCLEIAEEILSSFNVNGVLSLMHLNYKRLISIEGVGEVKAIMLMCIGELARRINMAARDEVMCFHEACQIAEYFMEELRHLEQERLIAVMLDARCGLIHETVLSCGTANQTFVSSRELFMKALEYKASYIVILHNHPCGDPNPSEDDVLTTDRICECGELLGIPLIDHIIIGDGRYFSFKEKNLL